MTSIKFSCVLFVFVFRLSGGLGCLNCLISVKLSSFQRAPKGVVRFDSPLPPLLPKVCGPQGRRSDSKLYAEQPSKDREVQTVPEDEQSMDVATFLRSKGFVVNTDLPKESADGPEEEENNEQSQRLKRFMIDAIMWYKTTVSPLMPKNCRFLPTCSQYGLDAINKYGPIRGGILTGWRILRCNPFGGSGYDAIVWPPPGYFAGSNTFPKKKT